MMRQDTFPGVRIGLVPWAGLGPETFAESRTPPGRGTIIATSSSPATAKAANQPTHEERGRSGGASQCLRWRPEAVVRDDTTLLPVLGTAPSRKQ